VARTRTSAARNPDDPLVRVRGGRKGFRMIALSDWKKEIKEHKQRKVKFDKEVTRIQKRELRQQRKRQ